MNKINVIGAGAWGTALAISLTRKTERVSIWCRNKSQSDDMNSAKVNTRYLPSIGLPNNLSATAEIETIANAEILLNVVPAQHLRENLKSLKTYLKSDTPVILCAKGIEKSSGKMMSEVFEEVLPNQPFGILSGPNFAHEVANGLPAATTLAAHSKELGEKLANVIGQPTFRPYFTDDVIGTQLGGSVKNVMAIACGIVAGAKLGENARAALITRGMAEILRLGEKLGAKPETMMGLSGFGDLVLTCSSTASRNYSLGVALGEEKNLNEFLDARVSVTEGVHTAAALHNLAEKYEIEMPISSAVHKIVNEGASVTSSVEALLSRPIRDEKLAGFST